MQQTRGNKRRIYCNCSNYQNVRPNSAQPQGSPSLGNRNQGFKQHQGNRPQCQLCGKYEHIAPSCYHWFDINFQGSLSHTNPNNNTFPNHNSSQAQAMVTSPTSSDSWFLDTGATHHLTNNATHLLDVHPYHGPDQVSIENGKKLPIHHIGSTILSTKYKIFKLNKRVSSDTRFGLLWYIQFSSQGATIHIVLTFALSIGWIIRQMDI